MEKFIIEMARISPLHQWLSPFRDGLSPLIDKLSPLDTSLSPLKRTLLPIRQFSTIANVRTTEFAKIPTN
ncbi:hypothetical protein [Sporosarcina sp. UB5]|uniref:hypothetical protein n=1 Tax=Sporosarcina sp. UB5 TaxID=3047463 RepID=UPI003D7B5CB2